MLSDMPQMIRKSALFGVTAAALMAAWTPPAQARVTDITITATTSPTFDGRVFGAVGTYEQIRGIASGELDPLDPRNAVITDIGLAPRNANGMVPYRTTFTLLKPVNMSNASGVMVYEVFELTAYFDAFTGHGVDGDVAALAAARQRAGV